MGQLWRISVFSLGLSLLWAAAPTLAQSPDGKAKTAKVAKPSGKMETVSGVIVKTEPLGNTDPESKAANSSKKARAGRHLVRLTINTSAVWRDWVRDQASATPKSPSQAASDGNKSVAASGEPQSTDSLVVVDLTHETKVETRYRSSTDEISEGAKSPGKAADVEKATDPADTSKSKIEPHSSAKAASFTSNDLKPGLFVEVNFHQHKPHDRASLIRVMRPVGGANIPAGVETPRK